jgi:hypothetical protein
LADGLLRHGARSPHLSAAQTLRAGTLPPGDGERTSQGGTPGSIVPLFPALARRMYLRAVMRGLVRFIHRYGYWPTSLELTCALGAYEPGVRWTLKELAAIRYAEHTGRYWRLTAAAWASMCIVPIAPWAHRPSSSRRTEVMRALERVVQHAASWSADDLAEMLAAKTGSAVTGKTALGNRQPSRAQPRKRGKQHPPSYYEDIMRTEIPIEGA